MQRGREQYNIHCAVCHGLDGYGGQGEQAHGMLGRKGMVGIANYHQDKYRDMADGEIFNTISNGKNSMSAYGHQIKVQDRWAIVAYIRALQLSQNAPEPLPVPKGAK
jgi:mono/diheme cytochrome c family protein